MEVSDNSQLLTIGSQLRKLREQSSLSLSTVAQVTGIDELFLVEMERNEFPLTKELIIRLAQYYGMGSSQSKNESLTGDLKIPGPPRPRAFLRVAELFAGVGGFRLGLEGWQGKSASSGYTQPLNPLYQVVWSNQWEPSTKVQHASQVYEARFGKNAHFNNDIGSVDIADIPDHDVLVGGFPCQDYSVATTLKNAKGLIGKKGVLWWAIHKILCEKTEKPNYLFFENVDRLMKSPAKQRGRDFAVILKSLSDLGYGVEWRVLNAADYGMPQRRRRVFILAYLKGTAVHRSVQRTDKKEWILHTGTLATAFPVTADQTAIPGSFELKGDMVEISASFNQKGGQCPFENSGVMTEGTVTTLKVKPMYRGQACLLKDILQQGEVPDCFYIDEQDLAQWRYLKGPKKAMRVNASGFEYHYSEGGMLFPDALDKPSRTIITGEGGRSPSRFKHVVQTHKGLRRLSPVELERLNMFPEDHTKLEGISDAKRSFFMGNALVVGAVEKIGIALHHKIILEGPMLGKTGDLSVRP